MLTFECLVLILEPSYRPMATTVGECELKLLNKNAGIIDGKEARENTVQAK